MAKGIIPLKAFRELYGDTTSKRVQAVLHEAFQKAIVREAS
jgi:hypothetical protein